MLEKEKKTAKYVKVHYRAIYETKEKVKRILGKVSLEYEKESELSCVRTLRVPNGVIVYFGDLTGNRTPIARMKTWCPNR